MTALQIWRPAFMSKFTTVSEEDIVYILAEKGCRVGRYFAQALLHFEQNKRRYFPEGSYS